MNARNNKIVVVLAEDDVTLRHALRDALVDASFDVLEASDGVQLLELLETHRAAPPDVVITDVEMPILSGLDVLSLLRAEGNQLPVVVVTGNDAVSIKEQAERFGAIVMRKPLGLAQLIERVRTLAGDRGA